MIDMTRQTRTEQATRTFAKALAVTAAAIWMLALNSAAFALNIQKVTSPGGITAWLVEEHSNPIISLRVAFKGGTTQDLPGKAGVANFTAKMLFADFGTHKLSFAVGRDYLGGTVRMLSSHQDRAFRLLRHAITIRRFNGARIERTRRRILSGLNKAANTPASVAATTWRQMAFGDHAYARPVAGNVNSVRDITGPDMIDYLRRVVARDKMVISVAGDIDAKTLAAKLDEIFGALPQSPKLAPVADTEIAPQAQNRFIAANVPQSVLYFGHAGIKRADKDFMTAHLLNTMVRRALFDEVRNKRGLTYAISSSLLAFDHSTMFIGQVQTRNEVVNQALSVIVNVLKAFVERGPSQDALDKAKLAMISAFAFSIDANTKIAARLQWLQIGKYGADYVQTREHKIAAITLDDVRRVAKRLLKADKLITVIVGKPQREASLR
jgi:zinc protease